jgi:hypothetical protein
MADAYEDIDVSVKDDIAVLTLRRPALMSGEVPLSDSGPSVVAG